MTTRSALGALALAALAAPLAAQDSTRAAAPDTVRLATQVAVRPAALPRSRANWYSDRQPLRVGDIITIVVDEQTRASESVSQVASGSRSLGAKLNVGVDSASRIGPNKAFATSHDASSRDVGQASRNGDLTAVLTVRVTEIDAVGNAKVEGRKVVNVDGRAQNISLTGVVRPNDVSYDNLVSSSRVADAVITYKGKKIGPRTGILGKILSILWP